MAGPTATARARICTFYHSERHYNPQISPINRVFPHKLPCGVTPSGTNSMMPGRAGERYRGMRSCPLTYEKCCATWNKKVLKDFSKAFKYSRRQSFETLVWETGLVKHQILNRRCSVSVVWHGESIYTLECGAKPFESGQFFDKIGKAILPLIIVPSSK